jgi:transposase
MREGEMVGKEECMEIWALKRQGYSNRAIARKLGIHRKTVSKYLAAKEFPQYRTVKRQSALEPYYGMIGDWLSTEDYHATRVHELAKQQGYRGSYETVKRYVRTVKERRDRIAYLRFETLPGQQAQVDFGDFQILGPDGQVHTLYVFVMVLGYSRHMHVEFVERCTMTTFLDCHINAFNAFEGVPSEILYDNMKNVVVRQHVGKTEFNATFLDFAAHNGFKPVACPPYSPWYKGKVERPMDYIRERFWRGYQYIDLQRLNGDIRTWNNEVASMRVHGTTKERVSNRFERERTHLGALPLRTYDTSEKVTRKVYKDCQISFDGNRYVVPHTLAKRTVLLKIKNGMLRIYDDEKLCAVYQIPEGKGHLTAHPEFYDALKKDKEQMLRKYRIPSGKAKATRGLLKDGLIHEIVQRRPLSAYDAMLEVSHV